MATLPNPSEMQTRAPVSATGVTQRQVVDSGLGDFGRSIAQAGAAVAQELDRIDSAKAEDALTQLKKARIDLTLGEDGYSRRARADIVNTPRDGKPFVEDYAGRFKARADEIGSTLSAGARQLFDKHASREAVDFSADVLKHSVSETTRYRAEAADNGLRVAVQESQIYANDPNKLARAFDDVERITNNMLAQGDATPQQVEAIRLSTYSSMHESIALELANGGQPEAAAAYIDRAEKDNQLLNPAGLRERILAKGNEKAAMMLAGSLFSALPANAPVDVESVYKLGAEKLGPDASAVQIKMFRAEVDKLAATRRASLDAAQAAPLLQLIQGAPIEQVRASPEYAALDTKGKLAVESAAPGGAKPADYVRVAKIDALASNPAKLKGMSRDEVVIYAMNNNLGTTGAQSLLAAHTELQKPNGLADAQADNTDLKNAFLVAGKSVPKENDEEFIRAKVYMRQSLGQQQLALGRKLSPEERARVYADAMKRVVVDKGLLWDTTKFIYELSPEEQGAAAAIAAQQ